MQQDAPIFSKETDATLYELHAVSIFAYLRRHTTSIEDAEDLLIEVFTAALEQDNLSWLPENQHLAWLRRVAQNKLVDRYRRASHFRLHSLEEGVKNLRIEDELTPEQLVLRREELEVLSSAVSKLSPLQQQILQFRLSDGLRFSEIAALVGKRENAVRQIFSRTLIQLRKHYQQK